MNGARYSYLSRICKLVEQGKDIIIVSEDYAAPMFDDFRVNYPKHFLSVGIAEQNAIAVASGLALSGKYAIAYGCAPFPLTRAIDQIKSAGAGMHLPMTILNSGIGVGVPEFGATHFNADDISIARVIPCIRIVTPTDNIMADKLADYSLETGNPLYIRFDKYSEGEVYTKYPIDFQRGFEVLCEGSNVAVVTCGYFTLKILELAEQWKKDGISAKVIDLYSLPYDETALVSTIGDLPLVTVEEHVLQGGIGSALLETLNDHNMQKHITRMGINFNGAYPHQSGSREWFLRSYGLSDDNITTAVFAIAPS
jgi:transketolase